jgi:primosomal protein N' (replication factor Y)
MPGLFQESQAPEPHGSPGPVVRVAVNVNVWGQYDYLWGPQMPPPQRGMRVKVPFGPSGRTTWAFVTQIDPPVGNHKLKYVLQCVEETPQLDDQLWRLGLWIARYYLTPLGMVLAAMVPSAVGQREPRTRKIAYLRSQKADWPGKLGSKQRAVLDELLQARKQGVEGLSVEQLRDNSQAGADTISRLARRELIEIKTRKVTLEDLHEQIESDPFDLNEDQVRAFEELKPRLDGGFSATVLHGVTGSGKTEVYIRAIRKVIDQGKQAILLVPEIALATQTLARLLRRLPRVAVLHSGLTDAERDFHWRQIRQGNASVVVGPRSAVFAPTPKLGLIIVDEEHEGSYKQDTAPRYHGRDVAVMRASLAKAPVLLGSATPSMETWRNVQAGRYDCLKLARRVRSLPMPKLEVVSLRGEMERGKIELIGRTMTQRIAHTLEKGQQAILLMNRRGYASYVFCPSCEWTLACEDCTRTMVFHQATQLAMCHYCNRTASLPDACPACGGKILLFGMGIQRIEGELARKFPMARSARMDSDTMTTPGQFQKVFEDFGSGEIDILLGTQMVAKGLDFPKVTLVGVLSADTSLAIPDFRASERTFQLTVQVAGRAGRGDAPGNVIVQTLHPQEPSIRFAIEHDYEGFAAWELPAREEVGLPPCKRMIRFVARHRDGNKAQEGAAELSARLRTILSGQNVDIWGPQPAGVLKIRGQFRFQVLLLEAEAGVVQSRLYPQFARLLRGISAEILADVDPMALI